VDPERRVELEPLALRPRETGEQLVSEVPGAELFLYPGSTRLFTDRSWEEYDEASTALVIKRTLAFPRPRRVTRRSAAVSIRRSVTPAGSSRSLLPV
jgi:hypothetical protein